jgi:hypothetical protein
MRTHNEIVKDLLKYSQELSNRTEDFQRILIEYNNILKELDAYYKIYCSKCYKEHSECKCKNNLMQNSSS